MNNATLTILSLVLSGIALIVGVYTIFSLGKIRSWRRWFRDQNEQPENLEQIITSIASKIKTLQNHQLQHKEQITQLQETLSFAVQQIGIVRYNSQADDGGNLSFSLALLDAHKSGFIITSLHGRQQNRIYSKQVNNGDSEVPLSEEERDALFAAIRTPAPMVAKPLNKVTANLKTAKPKIKRNTVKV